GDQDEVRRAADLCVVLGVGEVRNKVESRGGEAFGDQRQHRTLKRDGVHVEDTRVRQNLERRQRVGDFRTARAGEDDRDLFRRVWHGQRGQGAGKLRSGWRLLLSRVLAAQVEQTDADWNNDNGPEVGEGEQHWAQVESKTAWRACRRMFV